MYQSQYKDYFSATRKLCIQNIDHLGSFPFYLEFQLYRSHIRNAVTSHSEAKVINNALLRGEDSFQGTGKVTKSEKKKFGRKLSCLICSTILALNLKE
jgi:hypothetical protein